MAVPVLLLDIDGVVNVIRRRGEDKPPLHIWPESAWQQADIEVDGQVEGGRETFPLLWSEAVVSFLTRLHASGQVEIRWHSSWQAQAIDFARLVRLPDWYIHPCPEFNEVPGRVAARQIASGYPGWWKFMAARRVLAYEQRPLIWVDDDITGEVSRFHRDELGKLGELLIVSPDQYTGLTPKNLGKIADFVERMGVARGALSGS